MIVIKMQLERLRIARNCLTDLVLIPNEIEDTVIAAKSAEAVKQIQLVERFLNNFNKAITSPEIGDPDENKLYLACVTQMYGAINLIHLFKNGPTPTNNAIQVDPVIKGLQIIVETLKERLRL
jgi:hypothetical protein